MDTKIGSCSFSTNHFLYWLRLLYSLLRLLLLSLLPLLYWPPQADWPLRFALFPHFFTGLSLLPGTVWAKIRTIYTASSSLYASIEVGNF